MKTFKFLLLSFLIALTFSVGCAETFNPGTDTAEPGWQLPVIMCYGPQSARSQFSVDNISVSFTSLYEGSSTVIMSIQCSGHKLSGDENAPIAFGIVLRNQDGAVVKSTKAYLSYVKQDDAFVYTYEHTLRKTAGELEPFSVEVIEDHSYQKYDIGGESECSFRLSLPDAFFIFSIIMGLIITFRKKRRACMFSSPSPRSTALRSPSPYTASLVDTPLRSRRLLR